MALTRRGMLGTLPAAVVLEAGCLDRLEPTSDGAPGEPETPTPARAESVGCPAYDRRDDDLVALRDG